MDAKGCWAKRKFLFDVRFVLREEKVEVGPLWGETHLPSLVMEILAEGEHYGRLELQGKTRETEGGLKLDSSQFPLPLTYNRSIHFLMIVLGHSEVEFGLKSYEWLTKLDESDLSIASMITDRIGRHEVLLPINLNRYKIQKKTDKQLLLLGQTFSVFSIAMVILINSVIVGFSWVDLVWLAASPVLLQVSNYSQLSVHSVWLQM